MYINLVKIMKSSNVSKKDIATFLGLRYATVLDKFSGKSRFFYDEAKKIKDNYFPEFDIEYLFDVDDK